MKIWLLKDTKKYGWHQTFYGVKTLPKPLIKLWNEACRLSHQQIKKTFIKGESAPDQ